MSAIALLAAPAFGQSGPADEAQADGYGVEDIIVTAQKREQSMQDVPVAVTALSQDALQANRITNMSDLAGQAPNLSVRETAGGVAAPNFSMRGAVSYGVVAGQDKAISLYLDGVYIGTSQGSTFELPDLERIEVLRGPQGTLFGRNATAGAISVITRDPSGEYGVRQQFTYGNYDQFRSSTRVELPQVGPFSASVSYTHDERTGDIRNLGAGTVWDRTGPQTRQGRAISPKTLGDKNAESVFVAVKFAPAQNFNMVYKFDWMENHYTPDGHALVVFTPEILGPLGAAPLIAAYNANPVPLAGAHRPTAVNNAFSTPGYQQVYGHNLTMNLQLSDSVSIKNILAYRKSYFFTNTEIGGTGGLLVTPAVAAALEALQNRPAGSLAGQVGSPFVVAGNGTQNRTRQWSDELQVNYDSDFVTVTAGAIWFDMSSNLGAPIGLSGPVTVRTVVPNFTFLPTARNLSFNKAESIAGYVQAEVHVADNIDVVGGYRLTRDEKSGTSYVADKPYPFQYKDTRSSFMGGVNFRPADDVLVYGKYSTGFVSGGSVSGIGFAPETVKSWEAGLKSDLFDRRMRFNLAAFIADYKNIQAVTSGQTITPPQPQLGLLLVREGDLKSKGVELEATVVPVQGLKLNGALGYTKNKMTNRNPAMGINDLITVRPKWTASGAVQYDTQPIFGDAYVMMRVDANWRSKMRSLSQRGVDLPLAYHPLINSKATTLVNARLALRDIDIAGTKAEIALWGKNLTDSDNIAQSIYYRFLGTTNYQRARTYGADLTFEF